jgi:hypothetical protein
LLELLLSSGWVHPVVSGTTVVLAPGTDEGCLLGASHIVRVTWVQVAVSVLVLIELYEGSFRENLLDERIILFLRSRTPDYSIRMSNEIASIDAH